MMRVVIAILLCCAHAAGQAVSDRRGQQILRLEAEWRAAQQHNDRPAFDRLLSPDATFIGTSGSFRDKAGFIASRGGSWIPRAEAYTYAEVLVRFYGNAAVVTGVEATSGEGVSARGRFTHVWSKRGGKWMLVAIQRTEISAGL